MTSCSIDPAAMQIAIPQVENLISLFDDVASALAGLTVPPGVPAGMAANVTSIAGGVRQDLWARARALDALPGDLLRRISAAQIANAPWMIAFGGSLPALGLYARSFSMQTWSWSMANGRAARDVLAGLRAGESYRAGSWRAFRTTAAAAKAAGVTRGVPSGLAAAAKWGGKGVKFAGWGMTAYSNFRNPYLTAEQKVGRTGAAIATSAGVSAAAGLATGAAIGGTAAGPVGALVGAGAGVAWTALDNKFGISRTVGDAAADTADTVEDAAGDAAGAVKDGVGSAAKKVLSVF